MPRGQIYVRQGGRYRDATKRVLCAAFQESLVGVVDLKKLLVVVVGLLGAILAGGANVQL
jgi:hypothetical protein